MSVLSRSLPRAATAFSATMACLLVSFPAHAHLDPSSHGSFAAGLTHPIFGLDHVLAMVAVGLWGALLRGRALWLAPTGFVSGMILGYGLSLAGFALPLVEPFILASVVVLGVLVAIALRVPVWLSALLCGAFGLFHGHAHGGEIGDASELAFGAGFVLATAFLHGFGVFFGYGVKAALGAETRNGELAIRFLGGATAIGGAYLIAMG